MTWIETDSLSFTARHDDADTGCAQRILDRLEELRLRLEERFPHAPGDVNVVVHDNPAWLSAAHPLLPVVRWTAAPAARRYLAGWPMLGEIHVLNDEWTERRAAGEDSLRALRGTAERMYCQLVLAANNDRLPPMWTPPRFYTYLRWAWLVEGAAQYFCGQTSLFRAAVITRLRDGERPRFPPSRRDAILLGGTIFDLLDRHAGPEACARLASRLHRDGPEGSLELAFDARMREIERAWREHLDEIVYRQRDSAASTLDQERRSPLPREEHEAISLADLGLGGPSIRDAAAGGGDEEDVEGEAIPEPWAEGDPAPEPRLEARRRGRGLRKPSGADVGAAPDFDLGVPPEFSFGTAPSEGIDSPGEPVEKPDEGDGDEDGSGEPGREPPRRPDSRE